jgi:Big-like domain-containing protein/glucodextranase-like protein
MQLSRGWNMKPWGDVFRASAIVALSLFVVPGSLAAGKNQPPTVSLTSPASNSIFAEGVSITLGASASDVDGTITQVQFLAGTQVVGTTATSPYSATWTPAAPGTYSLTAKATDNGQATATSSAVLVTVLPNSPPSVSITAPTNGAGFAAPATISILAAASDSDGSVSKVEFYQGSTLLFSSLNPPYSFDWTAVGPGTYTLTAKATDDKGGIGTSATISVSVGTPPIVVLKQPDDCSVFVPAVSITLAADAVDQNGWIKKVEFYAGTTPIGTATRKPYTVTWSSVPQGTYTLTARASNHLDLTSDSPPITIKVEPPNTPSTVQITQPDAGTNVRVSSTVIVIASASDPDGVKKVIFNENGVEFGSSVGPTFSAPWTPTQVGTRQLTATVIDNRDSITTSAEVAVNAIANALPTANLTSPANNAAYREPATVAYSAAAADSDGNVTQGELLLDGQSLLTVPGAGPYSGNLPNVPAGAHTVQVRVKDNDGGFGLSNVANINVAANSLPNVQISAPTNGSTFDAPGSIVIAATASDPDGSVTKVEFFADGTSIGSSTGPSFSVEWSGAALGVHSLTAVATDNDGGTRTSATVSITVNGVTATITAPANGASYVAPAGFNITATAITTAGGITTVELYDAIAIVSTISVPPGNNTANVTFTMTGIATGSHVYKVVAHDGGGRSATSATITVNVAPPPSPPSISLTSPVSGTAYSAPAEIRIRANVAAGSNPISQVEFLSGTTSIGTSIVSPYELNWSNIPVGSYTLSAKATDTGGAATTSATVSVVVGNLALTIDSPLNGALLPGNAVLVTGTIQAPPNSGVTVNGRVAAVDADGRYYLTAFLAPGVNTITAKVTTSGGATLGRDISVTSDGVVPLVSIEARDLEGPFPLTATFEVSNADSVDVAVRLNGTSVGTVPKGQSASFTMTVTGAGSLPVSITAWAAEEQRAARDFVLVAYDPAQIDTLLRTIWGGMIDALVLGDKAAALSYLPSAAKAKYGPLFDALMPNFAQIVATFSGPVTSSLSTNVGEYLIRRSSSGMSRAYFIYFVRGADGVWRLDEM